MRRILVLLLACMPLFCSAADKDTRLPQYNATTGAWPSVTISPAANSLLGFGGDKTFGGVAMGSGAAISSGIFTLGAITPTSVAATGTVSATQLTSTIATGTAPLVVASTTNVANLNASSLGGATFAAPGAIGGGTPNTGAFTTLNATVLTPSVSVTPDAGALKHKRVSTGSIGGGSSLVVTVTWGTAFADANYTATASVLDTSAALASLRVVHIESVSASAVTVRIENTAVGAHTGTVNVIAMHD